MTVLPYLLLTCIYSMLLYKKCLVILDNLSSTCIPKVCKLIHLKSIQHYQHEYLLIEVDVVMDKGTKTGILVIDCNPGSSKVNAHKDNTSIDHQDQPKPSSNNQSFNLSSTSIPTSLHSSASSASRSCSDVNASDHVIVPASGNQKQLTDLLHDKYEELCTLKLPTDIFPLAELAALPTIVSKYKEEYTALEVSMSLVHTRCVYSCSPSMATCYREVGGQSL